MKSYLRIHYILTSGLLYLFVTICLFAGCRAEEEVIGEKAASRKEPSYPVIEISMQKHSADTLVYNPMNNILSSVKKEKSSYQLNTWQEENGWTTGVASWKIKKNQLLDNFAYNTTGALFACLKTYKKGQLYKQDIVRLRGNGSLQSLSLIGLENVRLRGKSSILTEITDLQCCGTALAITYQYGSVKIYNIAEKQALGASNITGTDKHSIFYDLHYLTVKKDKSSQEVLLQDYDIRSGEITHTFPLGGNGQDSSDFHLSNYQNELYLLSKKGIYTGSCTETLLTKQIDYKDLPLPNEHRIVYLQAARDKTIYLGYETSDKTVHLLHITIPSKADHLSTHSSAAKNFPIKSRSAVSHDAS